MVRGLRRPALRRTVTDICTCPKGRRDRLVECAAFQPCGAEDLGLGRPVIDDWGISKAPQATRIDRPGVGVPGAAAGVDGAGLGGGGAYARTVRSRAGRKTKNPINKKEI